MPRSGRIDRVKALHRQTDACPQAPQRTVFQHDLAAMGPHDIAGDRQAKAGATGGAARIGAEHAFTLIRRNAGTVVIDRDQDRTALGNGTQRHMPGMTAGVVHQVGDGAPHRIRT